MSYAEFSAYNPSVPPALSTGSAATSTSSGGTSPASSYSNPFGGIAPIAADFQTNWYQAARAGLTSFTGQETPMASFVGGDLYPTTPTQSSGFWGGAGDFVGALLNQYLGGGGSSGMGLALPGGTDIDLPGADLLPGDPMSRSFWTTGNTMRYRQVPEIVLPSPDGRLGVWKSAGRPILYSGDLAACRRVNRVASRVARVARRRGGSSVRRRRGGR